MTEAAPSEPPIAGSPPPAASRFRHTRWVLIAFYSLAVVWGVRHIRPDQPSHLELFVPIAFSIALGWWALVDARRRGHPIPLLARPWFFLLAGPVVAGYVIWSRGWRGVGWVVLHAVLWYALAVIALNVGGVVVYGEEWLRAHGL